MSFLCLIFLWNMNPYLWIPSLLNTYLQTGKGHQDQKTMYDWFLIPQTETNTIQKKLAGSSTL